MRRAAALLALALLAAAAGCSAPAAGPPGASMDPAAPPPPRVVRMAVLGDAGTGEADQAAVAAAIASVCAARGCDLALALGDNVYPAGASSPDDPQFDAKFERPYANLTLPFWLVLGNHDNGDPGASPAAGLGPWYETGNNQVRYAQRTDRPSDKWHMPARHYNLTAGAGLIGLFALDTNTLVYHDLPVPPDLAAQAQAQGTWVDAALAASRAPWRIAFGHHPYVSNGPHGDAGAYDGRPGVPGLSGDYLQAFVEGHLCGKVDLYLAGHDHNLQWLPAVPSCGGTEFVVSGGGGAETYPLPGGHPARFQKEAHGFWWLEVAEDRLTLAAHDAAGALLFSDALERGPGKGPVP